MRRKSKHPRPWLKHRLMELRKEGKTFKGLADALHLPPSRVSEMIKGGRDIYATELQPMATYLDWSPDELRKRNDQLSPQSTTSGNDLLTSQGKRLTSTPREVEEMQQNKELLDFINKAADWPPDMRAKLVKMANLLAPAPSETKGKRKRLPR